MKKTYLLCLGVLLRMTELNAQTIPVESGSCGADEVLGQMLKNDPHLQQYRDELETKVQAFIANGGSYKTEGGCLIYIIPTVIHKENTINEFDLAGAQEMLDQLNMYFRKRNPYIPDLVGATQSIFRDIVADVQIEFHLAQKDKNGMPTPGFINEPGFNSWNINPSSLPQYFEIYVTNDPPFPNAAAIATYPGGPITSPSVMGLVGGPILAHEVGHWLNLYHAFGNTNASGNPNNCSNSDGVDDTPPCKGGTSCYSPESNPINTCHNDVPDLPDNYQNFMDYHDACRQMFTEGQKARMWGVLQTEPTRQKLWIADNLALTGLSKVVPKYPCITTDVVPSVKFDSGLSIYPNPLSEQTFISFSTTAKEVVTFSVYSLTGDKIIDVSKEVSKGSHAYQFQELLGGNSITLASGAYLFRLDTSSGSTTKMLMKP